MYSEDDLIQLSALEHLVFCERQCALIHIEQAWSENVLTAEGRVLHQKTHSDETTEARGNLRITRGLRLHSLRLGLAGKADVVEFHRVNDTGRLEPTDKETLTAPAEVLPDVVSLAGVDGLWIPFPIEYKRGILRHEEGFDVQLCAQALCIEEMMHVQVPAGAIFYGKTARRKDVVFDHALRARTEQAALRLHELFKGGKTPKARYEKKCRKCSLLSLCMPKITGASRSAKRYLAGAIPFDEEETP